MNIDLSGRNALVCGASEGIGKASAKEIASLGVNVTLLARNEEKLKLALSELANNNSQNHSYIVADFSKTDDLKNIIAEYAKNNICHILINNTGGPKSGKLIDAHTDEFLNGFRNHVIASQIITQALVPSMKSACFGRIINIISTSVKAPIPGLGVSNTIRGAMGNWSKTLSSELGEFGITVNNVLPGFTATARLDSLLDGRAEKLGKSREEVDNDAKSQIPAQRYAQPEEIASAVAFLASPAASYISGINLPVDGGRLPCL